MSLYFPRLLFFSHTLCFIFIQSIKAENAPENSCVSTNTLIKIDNLVKPRRQAVSEVPAPIPGYVVLSFLQMFPVLYGGTVTFSEMLSDFTYEFTCVTTTPITIETIFLSSGKFFCVPLQLTSTSPQGLSCSNLLP